MLKESIILVLGKIKEVSSGFTKFPDAIRKALFFLAEHNFNEMKDGTYPIDGKNSYAILQRYSTRLPESGKPEAHRQYVDIQYIVRGREELGWCPLNPERIEASPYDIEKDIVFYEKLVPGSSVVLDEGTFAVLYPADVHRPCGSVDGKLAPVTKVVVKIAVDYIK